MIAGDILEVYEDGKDVSTLAVLAEYYEGSLLLPSMFSEIHPANLDSDI
jgi:hypothetical protein